MDPVTNPTAQPAPAAAAPPDAAATVTASAPVATPQPVAAVPAPAPTPTATQVSLGNAAGLVDGACRQIRSAIVGEAGNDGTTDVIERLNGLLKELEKTRRNLQSQANPSTAAATAAAGLNRPMRTVGTRISPMAGQVVSPIKPTATPAKS